MFEELVRDVDSHWGEEGLLHLEFVLTASATPVRATFGRADIGALSLWLKQDHPPTPAEIATRLVERWDRNTDLAEASWGEKLADLERHIAAVIAAERAREPNHEGGIEHGAHHRS